MKRFTFFVILIFFSCMLIFSKQCYTQNKWGKGFEGQRKADLGNGTFLNPVLAGDYPDPSILRDGNDYYMVHSSFDYVLGLMVWHSGDLVNWEPVGPALNKYVGPVWAPEIVKHKGKYYIYFPSMAEGHNTNMVVVANSIQGPWSEPIDLKIGMIDPGHIVDNDGKRFLFFSGGYLARLSDDGTSIIGQAKKVYDGWEIPKHWEIEAFTLEGPKIKKIGNYFYLLVAQGGTAGPPTSHMVVAARSKNLEGPWENSHYNPIVHTNSVNERWWSKGHGSLIDAPDGKWYMVYHAYEKGFHTLGRQTLMQPVEWTADGWFKLKKGTDPEKPIAIPKGQVVKHGIAYSDNFSKNKIGVQWRFFKEYDSSRFHYEKNSLVINGKGNSPADCGPLAFITGDHSYQVEIEMIIDDSAKAGILLFYSENMYAGIGFQKGMLIRHRKGQEMLRKNPEMGNRLFLRMINNNHIVSCWYSTDGNKWTKTEWSYEVSGYHHNVMGKFLSLRPAIYAAGKGRVVFKNFRYKALN